MHDTDEVTEHDFLVDRNILTTSDMNDTYMQCSQGVNCGRPRTNLSSIVLSALGPQKIPEGAHDFEIFGPMALPKLAAWKIR